MNAVACNSLAIIYDLGSVKFVFLF